MTYIYDGFVDPNTLDQIQGLASSRNQHPYKFWIELNSDWFSHWDAFRAIEETKFKKFTFSDRSCFGDTSSRTLSVYCLAGDDPKFLGLACREDYETVVKEIPIVVKNANPFKTTFNF